MISPFFSPNTGGVETFLDDLIGFLNKQGAFVDVITYKPLTTNISSTIFETRNRNRIFRMPWFKFNLFYKLEKYRLLQLFYLSTGIGFLLTIYIFCGQARKITSVNCHGLSAGFIGSLLSFLMHKRFILTFHTNYRFKSNQLIGKFIGIMCLRYAAILTLSEATKVNLIELGVPEKKIFSYHNWVDKNVYLPIDKRQARVKLGLGINAFYALFVGRFSKEKGIFDLMNSVPLLNENIELILIGGGIAEERVKDVSQKYANVRFAGRKTPQELVTYFNAADILVYAPVDEDYLGRVAISALSCGLPIMLPSESAYLENIRQLSIRIPEDIGVTFTNNPASFAEKLNDIYTNRQKYRFNSQTCREYINRFYSEEVNANIIYNVLNA